MRNKTSWFCAALILFSTVVLLGAEKQNSKKYTKHASEGIKALQTWYTQDTGLYQTTGWWNSANAITVLADYSRISHNHSYKSVFPNTLGQAQKKFTGFLNDYYDDEGWWALAWIAAYDLNHDKRYLAMADSIFTDMSHGWDATCGGGIWWSKEKKYKNAIANELFLSVAAHLARRAENADQRTAYLAWAQKEWAWFSASGMINGDHLVNDGLDLATCKNNGKTTWTYNQGVILGGLAELNAAAPDPGLLQTAESIAHSAITHLSDAHGVLHDPCEPDCGGDGIQFKGIFMRNLIELNAAKPDPAYLKAALTNAGSLLANSPTPGHTFGEVWSGPVSKTNAGIQASAIDALLAAAEMSRVR